MRKFLSLSLAFLLIAFFPADTTADGGERPVLRVGYTDVRD